MLTDIVLLKAFSKADIYNQYKNLIDFAQLKPETAELIKGFGEFFGKSGYSQIDLPVFFDWFTQYLHPTLNETDKKYYQLIVENVAQCEGSFLEEDLVCGLRTRQLKNDISDLVSHGFTPQRIEECLVKFKTDLKRLDEQKYPYASNNIYDILAATNRDGGLQFRLKYLRRAVPPLIKGDLGLIGGYVDLGKTTLAMSEAAYMAEQMHEGCLLWLNNEQNERLIQKRLWQSLLNMTKDEIESNPEATQNLVREKLNGDLDRIKVLNVHGKTIQDIKNICEQYEPRLVVIDRIDKIVIPKMQGNASYQVKGRIAGDIRQLAKQTCPIIGTIQASARVKYFDTQTKSYKFVKYPDQNDIHDSQVDVPSEADFIIMIGGVNDSPRIRGIHVCKNKEGDHYKFDAEFDGLRVRYKDAE